MAHETIDRMVEADDALAAMPKVVLIEDDRICCDEYAESLASLGYDCVRAYDGPQALRLLAVDRSIGIVVTDLFMPQIDGLSVLREISARFAQVRPIVAVVITGHASLESAIEAMNVNAVDYLIKPVTLQALSQTMRRASERWSQLTAQARAAAAALPLPSTRENHALGATEQPASSLSNGFMQTPKADAGKFGEAELLTRLRTIARLRRQRGEFLDADLFSDPAWDMLLDLTAAGIEGKQVPVSSVCAAAQVPLSTGLRQVKHLVEMGWVIRRQDPNDKRRDLLTLSEDAFQAMKRFLATMPAGTPVI